MNTNMDYKITLLEKDLKACRKEKKSIEEDRDKLEQKVEELEKAQNVLALSVMRAMSEKMTFFDQKIQICRWLMSLEKEKGFDDYFSGQGSGQDKLNRIYDLIKRYGFEYEEDSDDDE